MTDECCFCGNKMGALVKLYQGWCCIKCFKWLLDQHSAPSSTKEEKKP